MMMTCPVRCQSYNSPDRCASLLNQRRPKRGSKSGSSSAINLNLGSISVARFRCAFARAFEKQLDQIAPIYPESPGLFDDPKDWEKPQ